MVDTLAKRYGVLPSKLLKEGDTFDLLCMDVSATYEYYKHTKAQPQDTKDTLNMYNKDDLQERMESMENEFYEEAENFLEHYDEFIEVAQGKLGSAFNIEDYPDVNDLRKKFVFNFKIKTIPQVTNADDIRLNVSAKMKQRIQSEAEDTIKHNIKNVFKVTVEALLEQVNHIVEKLKKGEQFHARSFDKLRQTVDMLPSINEDILNNDKDIANAHQGLLTVLTSINSFDSLRDDTELGEASRKRVVDDLEKSVDDLKGSFFNKAFGGNDD